MPACRTPTPCFAAPDKDVGSLEQQGAQAPLLAGTRVNVMKYRHVAESYDKTFSEDATAHGGEPMPLVHLMERSITSGDVLDIGAGRKVETASIWLLAGSMFWRRIYQPVAIKNHTGKGTSRSISPANRYLRYRKAELARDFDVVICANVLHHLHADDAGVGDKERFNNRTRPRDLISLLILREAAMIYTSQAAPQFFLDNKEHLKAFIPTGSFT